jgi:hypothetical protein
MAKKAPAKKVAKRRKNPSDLRNQKIVVPVTASERAGYLEDAGRKSLAEHVRDALEVAHETRLARDRQRRALED